MENLRTPAIHFPFSFPFVVMAAMTLLLVSPSPVFHINYESAFGERKIYLAYISITVLFFLSAAYIFFFARLFSCHLRILRGPRCRIGMKCDA